MAGRLPKPTAIRKAEGNPGKRRLNRGDLSEPTRRPTCPAWLDKVARAKWRELVKTLEDRGILRSDDQALLAQFCADWSDVVLARKQLQQLGENRLLVKTEAGFKMNPLLRIVEAKTESLVRLAARFGFSPADRARIVFDELPGPRGLSPLEALLAGPVEMEPTDTAIQ